MAFRNLLLALCPALVLAGVFLYAKEPGPSHAESSIPVLSLPADGPQPVSLTEGEFRLQFPQAVNDLRRENGYPALTPDAGIGQWLATGAPTLSCATLETALASAEISGFGMIRAVGATGDHFEDLQAGLLPKLARPDTAKDDRFGLLVRALPDRGHEVIVITGEALPELTPAALNAGSARTFVMQCVHCRKRSTFEPEKSSATLILDCPECGRCTRVLCRDTAGRYHDATSFLIPSPAPSVAPGTHPLDAMIAVWRSAVARTRYIEDTDASEKSDDVWQTPLQTLKRKTGDCEDSALLLTDWMLTNRIPARMAVGSMDGGGHAWCVVRVEETDYLLESTNRDPDLSNLPAVNPNDGYVPTALFDREALYVRAHPDKSFDGDYWSPEKWLRLPRAVPVAARK